MTQKHSPLPWVNGWRSKESIDDATGFTVANTCYPATSAEGVANRDLIVRAVNSHADLIAELAATADWLTERAKIMRTLASLWPAGGPKSPSGERKQWMTDEASRFEGRAVVIRQTILKATQGA